MSKIKYNYLTNKTNYSYIDYWFIRRMIAITSKVISGEGTDFELLSPFQNKFREIIPKGDTYQVSYSGVNIFDKSLTPKVNIGASASELETGVRITSTESGNWKGCVFVIGEIAQYLGKTIKVTTKTSSSHSYLTLSSCDANGGNRSTIAYSSSHLDLNITATMPETSTQSYMCIVANSADGTTGSVGQYIDYTDFMVYVGTTVIPYQPYVGGIPSPNIDYPQPLHYVTGTQTLSITSESKTQNYTIRLGNIKLGKIATNKVYQDYIYYENGKWYIHNDLTTMTLDPTSAGWSRTSIAGGSRYNLNEATAKRGSASDNPIICDYFTRKFEVADGACFLSGASNQLCFVTTSINDLAEWRVYITNNPIEVSFGLATPTNTEITDTNLISDLNTILNDGYLYAGVNHIQTTAEGTNLPVIINIKA